MEELGRASTLESCFPIPATKSWTIRTRRIQRTSHASLGARSLAWPLHLRTSFR